MNQHKILNHTENYRSTGIIDDALIPYFTQDGRWIGDKVGWDYSTYVTTLNRMKGASKDFWRPSIACGGEWFMYPDDVNRWEQRKQVRIFLMGDNDSFFL